MELAPRVQEHYPLGLQRGQASVQQAGIKNEKPKYLANGSKFKHFGVKSTTIILCVSLKCWKEIVKGVQCKWN